MEINKSSRHSKITGDFAESLILYWLSKYGFECAKVDHTGIDLIARNPHNDELMGISVKNRSRNKGTENDYLSIPNGNFEKVENACKTFGCLPYFAIVVDAADTIRAYILSQEHLLELHPMKKRAAGWRMDEKWLDIYQKDDKIMKFEFKTKTINWWDKTK
jgi:Holliday junction resolvase-like predicted endonuclease